MCFQFLIKDWSYYVSKRKEVSKFNKGRVSNTQHVHVQVASSNTA